MNEGSLQTSFWVMVMVQTIGSVDMPGRGQRKMPSPRQYVAILVTWLVLQLIAGISAGAARATAAIGWLLVLVGMVVGPFGQRVISLFTSVANEYSVKSPTDFTSAVASGVSAGATQTGNQATAAVGRAGSSAVAAATQVAQGS
jgi:hypothetical protein